jgi:integrase
MRVRLKGINSVRKTLADGSVTEYFYAWKGGPRLNGRPGTPEFIASYQAAVSQKISSPASNMSWLLDCFRDSHDFEKLAPRTQEDYAQKIDAIGEKFGSFPLSGLSDRRARAIFLAWRDELAEFSLRQADYTFTVFARVLSWAKDDRGITDAHPLERIGRLYDGSRVDIIWSEEAEKAFLAVASSGLALAFMLGIWTGQREGDLLRLSWSAYDGFAIRLKQRKTGIRVTIPVGTPLKAALDNQIRQSTIILVNGRGKPWTEDGFSSSWRKAKKKAGITNLTFSDLRGTAVTRLAIAGATEPEISAITGHTLSGVRSILSEHYLHRDPQLAENAIRKLVETRTKTSN